MEAGRYVRTEPTQGRLWRREGHTATASDEAKREIGRRIKAQRQALGLKSRELADRLGRHASAVSDIERGVGSFSLGFLLQVSEALDVDPGSLFPVQVQDGEYKRGYRHGYLEAISRLQEDLPQG